MAHTYDTSTEEPVEGIMRCAERFCAPSPSFTPVDTATLRFAVVVFVCNGTSDGSSSAEEHLNRALRLRRFLRRSGSAATTVAVTHGYDAPSLAALRRVGWQVQDASNSIDPAMLIRPIGSLAMGKAGKHWPRVLRRTFMLGSPAAEAELRATTNPTSFKIAQRNFSTKNYLGDGAYSSWAKFWQMPRHTDSRAHACGTLPLLAWNLTSFDRVLVVSVDDACLLEDPIPWMRSNAGAYLIGTNDRSDDWSDELSRHGQPRTAYDGIDDRLLYLQPDAQVYALLSESARTGSYLPFSGRARDVIETVFPAHLAFPPLPKHRRQACSGTHVEASTTISTTNDEASYGALVEAASAGARPKKVPAWAAKRWWMLFRGEVAPKRGWPKRGHNISEHPALAGCHDASSDCHVAALGLGCGGTTASGAGSMSVASHMAQSVARMGAGDVTGDVTGDAADRCALSCGTCPALSSMRFALVVFICNGGLDHYGNPPTEQIIRALRLRRSISRLRSQIRTVAVVHGYNEASLQALRQVGWEVRDATHVDAAAIMKQVPRETTGFHWPRYRGGVQSRADNKCRAIHLLAWNLTEFDRVILSDLDLCMLSGVEAHTKHAFSTSHMHVPRGAN